VNPCFAYVDDEISDGAPATVTTGKNIQQPKWDRRSCSVVVFLLGTWVLFLVIWPFISPVPQGLRVDSMASPSEDVSFVAVNASSSTERLKRVNQNRESSHGETVKTDGLNMTASEPARDTADGHEFLNSELDFKESLSSSDEVLRAVKAAARTGESILERLEVQMNVQGFDAAGPEQAPLQVHTEETNRKENECRNPLALVFSSKCRMRSYDSDRA